MSVFGRIVKVNQKSTLLWNNGDYIKLDFASVHNAGDIIDNKDNLIAKCYTAYNHEQEKRLFRLLKNRFEHLKNIRDYFNRLGFLEITTPKLKKEVLDETNISLMKTPYGFLTPSPEVEIKKLLSLGFDKVFELCYAYRDDYNDKLHKKEFLILEWYRALSTPQEIIDDFIGLIKILNKSDRLTYQGFNIDLNDIEYIEYKELFKRYADIDIDNFNETEVKKTYSIEGSLERLDILDAIFAIEIEKKLGISKPTIVYNFPQERASLSKIKNGYAQRFELYIAGIELSNCYIEETDHSEIEKRFNTLEYSFLTALQKGLPTMSGIAVGVDRLLMIMENIEYINLFNIY